MKNKTLEIKTDTRTSLSPYQAERAEAQQTPGLRPGPLGAILAPPGSEATVRAHAAGLNRATAGPTLRRLQRQYGNRYVQRVVGLAPRTSAGLTQRWGGGEGFTLDDETVGRINRARGSGQPLDGALQEQMSTALGHDFNGVRVHTDSEADALNQQLRAKAFTTGQDIFFKRGAYHPNSSSGRDLIAHELSHVVQQSVGRVPGVGGSGLTVRPAGDAFEQEAHAQARWEDGARTDGIWAATRRQAERWRSLSGDPVSTDPNQAVRRRGSRGGPEVWKATVGGVRVGRTGWEQESAIPVGRAGERGGRLRMAGRAGGTPPTSSERAIQCMTYDDFMKSVSPGFGGAGGDGLAGELARKANMEAKDSIAVLFSKMVSYGQANFVYTGHGAGLIPFMKKPEGDCGDVTTLFMVLCLKVRGVDIKVRQVDVTVPLLFKGALPGGFRNQEWNVEGEQWVVYSAGHHWVALDGTEYDVTTGVSGGRTVDYVDGVQLGNGRIKFKVPGRGVVELVPDPSEYRGRLRLFRVATGK